MNIESLPGHRPLRVDVLVIDPTGRHVVQQFDRADLDDPVALLGVETGGFGIQNDLTHGGLGYER